MSRRETILIVAAITSPMILSARLAMAGPFDWPQFRGPGASGVAEGFATPTKWNAETGENIRWKTPIPGLGHSSPIIWGDKLFVTSAVSDRDDTLKVGLYGDISPVEDDSEQSWRVYCLDKKSGKILWDREAHRGKPAIKRHTKATHANCTPATDGEHVVAFFGSEGLYCFDMDGDLLWKKDFGVLDAGYYAVPPAQWEFGSSPIIHDGKVIVQCDVQKDSFIAALDVTDGKELWRTPRDEVPTWGTPTVHVSSGRSQVIANGWKHIAGYDLATGKELWTMKGGGDIPVPTPIVAHDLIFITNAHGQAAPVYAIKTDAKGDISLGGDETNNSFIAWSDMRIGNYMQTPLVYRDLLYCCRDSGIMSTFVAKTGKVNYRSKRLAEGVGFTASPVAADGKVYFTSEEGDVYVVKGGDKYELLSKNRLGETCMATPAISEGVLYFRARRNIIAAGLARGDGSAKQP